MRKIILILIFFLASGLVLFSFGELENTWKTLQRSDFRFIGLAVVLVAAWTVSDGLGYRALLRLMGVRERLWRLILLSSAANFINVVAPSGGFGGMAVFIDDAGRRKYPRGMAAAAAALHLFLDYAAFMVVLGLGWVVLLRRNDLDAGEMTASFLMLALFLALGGFIYVGSRSGEQLGKILTWLARLINRLLRPIVRRNYLSEETARVFSHEVSEGLSILRVQRRGVLLPLSFALTSKALQTLILLLTFLAFDVAYSAGTVVAGFATYYLFLIISPTPSGIGVVETLLPLALHSLNVPWEQSVVVTLTYRGLTFWLPLLAGAVSLRLLQRDD
ncbi:MAG: flippase-like domain-containing protein [Anaerolineales bacterium]|nr:flippase-like domain-containing protein [Anaerolineales bacterium]MCX7756407.1 flippase-like domain-containing protein [Anaerolineales bacterium]MDW8277766.1 lysylphosphatidylglycerol synthase transmembrane domain-containing protein [Anaerolineales bacterium]